MARILLADDDAGMRELIGRALSNDGHDVTIVEDGGAAHAHIVGAGPKPDLLISDVQMPGLDGVTLAEKAIADVPGLRVVLMSGFANAVRSTDHLRPNLTQLLAKPVSLDEMRAAVRGALA